MTYLLLMLNERHQKQLRCTTKFKANFTTCFDTTIYSSRDIWFIQCKHTSHTEEIELWT